MLRSHLISKVSGSIWKEAREKLDPQVPKCPCDQTEPQWTRLLFTRECSNCDKTNIPNVNWVHRLRLCYDCNRAGIVLILGAKVKKTFPAVEDVPSLLGLLPWSLSGSSWTGKYYRISDIQKIGAEWTSIRKRGNTSEIEEFKMRRVNEVQEIVDTSITFGAWDRNRAYQKRKDHADMKQSRKTEICARLEALGHDPSDVRSWTVTSSSAFSSSAQLTESRWNTIRPQLEIAVNQAKTERLDREYRRAVQSRQGLAENLVREYYTNSNIRPAFRPRSYVRDVISSKQFQDVIHQPTEVSVAREDFQEALDTVPELASNMSQEIQLYLLQLMVAGGAPDIDTSPTGSSFDALLLATATFFCKANSNGLPHCGAGELDEHSCFPIPQKPKFCCLSYDHRAGSAVAALLAVAGLDPNTTAEQMDEKDLRFSCLGCSNEWSRLAMSWRNAASHAKTVDHNEDNSWELFASDETKVIKENEKANIADVRFRFRCNTCYFPSVHRRKELEDHLWNYHSITDLPDPTTEFQTKPTVPPEPITVFGGKSLHPRIFP
ncbi:hypothetical protein M407DRAFT_20376 [Tulasnella calospora MUT 4182]|uniref:Uncharacterized protein n=1 Tax=Tulasnella calospora MUT 4182 TaxID=1051891 RepID=A0A0C3QQA9_9AGAM|nr:hypothetical protein M407DRAFT_20376 [Tulasnella calospora MUT 4182]